MNYLAICQVVKECSMQDIKEKFKNIPFTPDQWHELDLGNRHGIDVTEFANIHFSSEQMKILREAKENGIDIKVICSPDIPADEMRKILEHIYNEMGFYNEQYERTRRKWLKNITWMIVLAASVIAVCSLVYLNKDTIALYFENLELVLKEQVVQLKTNEAFNPGDQVESYSEDAELRINTNDFDSGTPGTYTIVYSVTNGKKTIFRNLIVNVIDGEAPVLKLSEEKIEIKKGDSFSCKAYISEVRDNIDSLSSEDVECSNVIDWEQSEQYIDYSLTDTSGNSAEETLLVLIKKESETETPQNGQISSGGTNSASESQNESGGSNNSTTVPSSLPSKKFLFSDGYMMPDPNNPNDPLDAYNACSSYRGNHSGKCSVLTGDDGLFIGYEYTPS